MNADPALRLQHAARGVQCQANSSEDTVQVRSRYLHICHKHVNHGDLHECFCGQLFDDLGENFTWENVFMPTVWTAVDTDGS